MRAAFIEGKQELVLRQLATPVPQPGQVRLKVRYVGICGSDLHYYYQGANGSFVVREPLIPGHEMSGEIDLDPAGEWAPGTPVTIHPARFGKPVPEYADSPHLWPGGSYFGSASTWPHTQGALCDCVLVERGMVRLLPARLPLRRAALAEPLSVAMHAVHRAGDISGCRVLVAGSGPIGLLVIIAALAAGAREVTATDVLDGPLARARQVGAAEVCNVGREQLPASAFDVAFECSGVPASFSAVMAAVRPAGRVVAVGMLPGAQQTLALAALGPKELTILGSFRFKDEVDAAVRLLAAQPAIERVITHEFPFDRALDAFAMARDAQASGKVIVSL